jgi:hypothetical protein
MARQPGWRRAFDTAERTIAGPLEEVVASHKFMDVVIFGRRARGVARAVVNRPAVALLHLANIPARTDVRRLSRQISALTNEVRELSATVEELRER